MKNYNKETIEYYSVNDPDCKLTINNSCSILSNEPIKQALNTIKDYCENNPTCEGCSYNNTKVLGKSGGCYFRHHSPREWKTDN